jgi:hypothetical protein
LTALTEDLNQPGTDLQVMLTTLTDGITAVVPSFLGLTITIHHEGNPVTLTSVNPTSVATARGCLLLCLAAADGFGGGDSVVFYAATPGAFAGLIAGTDPAAPDHDGMFTLDRQLPLVTDQPWPIGVSGLTELTMTNRAIGMRLDKAGTPESTRKGSNLRNRQTIAGAWSWTGVKPADDAFGV